MTAVVTDRHFSGANNGCFASHISPEAAEGGSIASVRGGDIFAIDIPNETFDWKSKIMNFKTGCPIGKDLQEKLRTATWVYIPT
jgi:dihydroxyacid dehydratase/phosphogluconate dehydratase